MSRTILVPVHELLAPQAAIESAATGFPDAELELVECTKERATMEVTIAAGSRAGSPEIPSDASGAFVDLAHETARAYDVDLRTATTTGSFGHATVAYAKANGTDMIILGVDRAKAETDPEVRENITYIQSAADVPYSIVRT